MTSSEQMNPQEARMQAILAAYLSTRAAAQPAGPHPDDDTIAAFTEGLLTEREAKPFIAHLVDCSFCRRVTADAARVDAAFAETPAISAQTEPARISEVLSGIFAKIFGSNEGAVFAHNEEDQKKEDGGHERPDK